MESFVNSTERPKVWDETVFFTIIARNYLAQALVLGRSLRRAYGRQIPFFVVVVDDEDRIAEKELKSEGFEFMGGGDLRIVRFEAMAFRYDVVELCTAVKPTAILRLFERGVSKVIYLDPDIEVYRPLVAAESALDEYVVVLTPHAVTPHDEKDYPSDRFVLQHGTFNLGFFGVAASEETRAFLKWWESKLEEDCRRSIDHGLFVDQKWMELVPGFLSGVHVLRNRGYNLAWWNLHERTLAEDESGAGWVIQESDEPLVFAHLSGFPMSNDELRRISTSLPPTNEAGVATLTLDDRPDLRGLVSEYAGQLKQSGHMEQARSIDYEFGKYSDGVAIHPRERRRYASIPDAEERWPDPFQSGKRSFQEDCERSFMGLRVRLGSGLRSFVRCGLLLFRSIFGHRNFLRLSDYVRTESQKLEDES